LQLVSWNVKTKHYTYAWTLKDEQSTCATSQYLCPLKMELSVMKVYFSFTGSSPSPKSFAKELITPD